MGDTAAVLPVQRFSPAPGLYVDRTEKSVSISGAMELFGPEANAARAQSVEASINSTWTASFPDSGYSVSCSITVAYRSGPTGNAAPIEALQMDGPSNVKKSSRYMTLNAKETDAFTWTAAHEFGHVIGLQDRYSESIMSKVKGKFGGTRVTTAQPGYQANIMAIDNGVLEGQNVQDLALENEPAPYWVNDDDQVREWVTHHSLADIGKLATSSKLQAIRTLMGGWISDDDIAAIARICQSVTSAKESKAIQKGIDTLDFSSIGQRTAVRVAFSKMPGGYLGSS